VEGTRGAVTASWRSSQTVARSPGSPSSALRVPLSVLVPKERPPNPTITIPFTIAFVLLSLMLLSFTFASLSLILLLLLLLLTLETIREAMLKPLRRKAMSWKVSICRLPDGRYITIAEDARPSRS
jgi:hypothetical protein